MNWIECKTQEELEAVCKRGDGAIVRSGSFTACGSANVTAYDSANVTAYGSANVRAYDSANVRAYGSANVTACDSANVRACDSANVTACDSANVTAYGSANVRAYGSANVRAYDSANVRAYGTANVRAYDSANVTAYGSANVTAYGSANVRASKSASVHVLSKGAKIKGGVRIKPFVPKTTKAWCEAYGVPVVRGVAILFKAVGADFISPCGGNYAPGSTPVAIDWDGGKAECGGGLHFSPCPGLAMRFNDAAKKYVACPVRLTDMRAPKAGDAHPDKIKASKCAGPVWECDINGKRIES